MTYAGTTDLRLDTEASAVSSDASHVLRYGSAASDWLEALPLGNGHLGAMYFGGPASDRISLNHDTLWSGYPECWRDHPNYAGANDDSDRSPYWKEARQLALEGRHAEADRLLQAHFTGPYTQSYLPLGDLELSFPGIDSSAVSALDRSLDLRSATAELSFKHRGFTHRRRVYTSHPDGVLVMDLSTDDPAGIHMTVSHSSPWAIACTADPDAASLTLLGQAPSGSEPSYVPQSQSSIVFRAEEAKRGMRFSSGIRIESDGAVTAHQSMTQTLVPEDNEGSAAARDIAVQTLTVKAAARVRLLWAAATSFSGFDRQPYTGGLDEQAMLRETLDAAVGKQGLYERHLEDYQDLYSRVNFSLEGVPGIPAYVPDRLQSLAGGNEDPELYVLLFNYSRYLMIAGSRPGTEALNLQGIWNREIRPPWSSNYTININTEMNYWLAGVLGLAECAEPLVRLIYDLAQAGRDAARIYYGAPGFVAHHNTDLWRHSRPVGCLDPGSLVYAVWPFGSGWLATHLRRYRQYSDPSGLAQDYPVLKAACEFYLSQLSENAAGELVFAPSNSPEHWYLENGERRVMSVSAAMSQSILWELFSDTLEAGELLRKQTSAASPSADDETAFLTRLAEVRDRLEIPKISSGPGGLAGTLQEWGEDWPEGDIHHRHVSHLYGLYPGRQISRKTPELLEACRKSLERRGDEGTGWSLGWKTALWAHLGDGDRALGLIQRQLRPVDVSGRMSVTGGGSYPNLLDAHPPFQIDGNFANGAAVAELFLQVQGDREIELLPALPASWGNAVMQGLRAPHGLEVSLTVRGGRLERALLRNHSPHPETWTVHCAGETRRLHMQPGQTLAIGS